MERARSSTGSLWPNERRQFMPSTPSDLEAAHYVALISDLSAEWIHDCYTERRKCTRDGDKQGTS